VPWETGNGKRETGIRPLAGRSCELSGAMRGKQKLPPHGTAAFGVLRWSGWTDRRPGPIVQRQAELVIRRSPLTGRWAVTTASRLWPTRTTRTIGTRPIGTEGQARLRARRPAWPSVDPSGFSGLAFSASRRKRPRSNLRNFPFPVSQLCRRGEGSTQRLFGLEIGCEEKSTTTFSFHPQCVALFTFRLAFCGPSFSDGRLGEVSISHKESKLQAFPISHFPFPPNTI
jgi:hypothetical protein